MKCMYDFPKPCTLEKLLKRITYISIGATLTMLHKYLCSSLPTWHARKDLEILWIFVCQSANCVEAYQQS